MSKLSPEALARLRRPTPEENAAILVAASSDPDALPLGDDDLAQFRPAAEVDPAHPGLRSGGRSVKPPRN
jgi:hypothetical protein